MKNETFYEYGRYKNIEDREGNNLEEFKKEVNNSGIIEQLSNLAGIYEEREKQGLFYNNDQDYSYINNYTEKFEEVMSNPNVSWEEIESAFGNIRFLLILLTPNYDTAYSSLETADSLKDLIDYFSELNKIIELFKGMVKDFKNQNKMVKIEINECFIFTEDICKRLEETSSLPYFSLTISELEEKIEELKKCSNDLEDKEEPVKEELIDQFASRSKALSVEKKCFLSDDSERGLLNPDDEIEIEIKKSNQEEDQEESKDFPGYEIRVRNKRIAEEKSRVKFDGTISEGSLEELEQFIKVMDTPTKEGRSIGYKGDAEALLCLNKDKMADEYKIITAKNEEKKIVGIAAISSKDKKSAGIAMLVVCPHYHSQGIGTAILSHIKSKYDYVHLSAIPKTAEPGFTFEYFKEKLDKFYKENGFVATREWSRDIASMDDKKEAGKWHEINDGSQAFGLNNEYLYTEEVIEKLFSSLFLNKNAQSQFSPEIMSNLKKWKAIYDKKRKTYKDRDSFYKVRRMKIEKM